MNKFTFGLFASLLSVPFIVTPARGAIIESATDSFLENQKSIGNGGSDGSAGGNFNGAGCLEGQRITPESSPVRAGSKSFRHFIDNCGKRAELSFSRTKIGETYWLGWSMYIPTGYRSSILSQWNTYPTPRNGKFPCGANGHHIAISKERFIYHLQGKGDKTDSFCTKFPLGAPQEVQGKWIDFVQQAKWTGDRNGFLKLWMRVGGGDYKQVIDYKGATWWNDEELGPYFKMGAYMVSAGFEGDDIVLYTDEYRLGDANSNLKEVSPGGSTGITEPKGILVEAEQMFLSAYRIESGNSAASGGSLISLYNAPATTDTASSTFSGSSGKYDVFVGYFDETDGVGSLKVSLGGAQIASWQLDQNLGEGNASAKTLVRKKIASGMSVNNGAKIEITGTANKTEWARVDYIEFVPVP